MPEDHLDGWVDWARSGVWNGGRRTRRIASMMLALIFEVRRLRAQLAEVREVARDA